MDEREMGGGGGGGAEGGAPEGYERRSKLQTRS